MDFQENISLAEYTTFKIGGPAKYFCKVKDKKDVVKAVNFAENKNLAYFILGGGSNILVSDKGFNGLIILINNKELEIIGRKIIAGAGVTLNKLVKLSRENNLTGLEWAVGIPGTIGGAVKVRVSAFGCNISEITRKIEKHKNIIFSIELELKPGDQEKSGKLIKEYAKKRKETQPLEYPSAGCIFKNAPGQKAGRLIDQAGLKGTQIGRAMISDQHANFIINLGGAKAEEVIKLIKLIKKTIKEKYKINLEEEIQYLEFG